MFPGAWIVADRPYRTLEGFPIGSTVNLQVRAWDSFAGSTWEQAAAINFGATQYGSSVLFTYTVPVCGSSPSCLFIEGLRGFMLVPEPSVIALAVLGAGGFLLLRRRK